MGMQAAAGTVENRVGSSRIEVGPPCGPAIPLLRVYPKEMETRHWRKPVAPRSLQRYSQKPRYRND